MSLVKTLGRNIWSIREMSEQQQNEPLLFLIYMPLLVTQSYSWAWLPPTNGSIAPEPKVPNHYCFGDLVGLDVGERAHMFTDLYSL